MTPISCIKLGASFGACGQVGVTKPKALLKKCPLRPSRWGAQTLERISKGLPPYHLRQWPTAEQANRKRLWAEGQVADEENRQTPAPDAREADPAISVSDSDDTDAEVKMRAKIRKRQRLWLIANRKRKFGTRPCPEVEGHDPSEGLADGPANSSDLLARQ